MKIKKMIEKVIEDGSSEKMYKLNEMLNDLICDLKEKNYELYKEYKTCLYELAYGKILNEEMAYEIVEKMKPYGEHWTMEEIQQVKKQYGLSDIKDIDFYVVMNSAYSDYCDMFGEDIDKYVEYSKLFINDKDAIEDKVYVYFMNIPRKD